MFGINVAYDENKNFDDILSIVGSCTKADMLIWLVLGLYLDMATLQASTGMPDIQERIDTLKPFTWSELMSISAVDSPQEGGLAAFQTEDRLNAYRLTQDPRLASFWINVADNQFWQIIAADRAAIDCVAKKFLHPSPITEDWFAQFTTLQRTRSDSK